MGTNSLSTYTSTYINLTADNSPFTITQTGTISTGNTNAAVFGTVAALSLSNAGVIIDTASAGVGVKFTDGGALFNSGTVTGHVGVAISAASGTVINDGGITGTLSGFTGGYGIELFSGGYVSNAAGAQITVFSGQGIDVAGAAGTVVNDGGITTAGNIAINLKAGGYVNNAVDATIYGGQYGVHVTSNTGTVINDGTIFTGKYGAGIYLLAGGNMTNAAGATLYGGYDGVAVFNAAGTVVNYGVIAGGDDRNNGGIGVNLSDGGRFTNAAGATVYGYQQGVEVSGAAGTIVNSGVIEARLNGMYFFSAGSVTNSASGSIYGGSAGIVMKDNGTVTNAGTIGMTGTAFPVAPPPIPGPYAADGHSTPPLSSTSRPAIDFESSGTNRLIVDPGAVFRGVVEANAAASNTLELASASSAGTLTGIGSQFVNFGSIAFDQGANWFIEGNTAGLGGTISGFAQGDTIEIAGITVTGSSFAGDVLTLTEASGSATLDLAGSFTTNEFQVTNVAGGAEITALCFCADTLIETPVGPRKVQHLAPGDLVVTFGGKVRPVVWIGTGAVLATRGRRNAATPVIVHKGALADNVPYHDLRVTKGHSFLIDDVLIPVEFLVNHRSIEWDDRAQEVKLYHIELETHDVLVANGAPAESYRDDGNRWLFHNANAGWHLPPQEPCAPVMTGGPVVDGAWRRRLDRAGPRHLPPLTEDPDLHLVIDGARVNPEYRRGSLYGFRLPSSPKSMVIASRAAVPAELGIARDPRSLGVALRQVAVRQGGKFMLLDAADDRLTVGFHAYEADCQLRWTDGCAALPVEAFVRFDKGAEVMLHLGGTTQYLDERARSARAAA
jgi:hypothetical protein